MSFLTAHTVPTRPFFVHHGSKCLIYDGYSQDTRCYYHKNLSRICKNGPKDQSKLPQSLSIKFGLVRMRTPAAIFEPLQRCSYT